MFVYGCVCLESISIVSRQAIGNKIDNIMVVRHHTCSPITIGNRIW